MQDHPTVDELLGAVVGFLRDDVMANTTGRINFHARVSANALDIIRRELQHEEEHLAAEWESLDALLGPDSRPGTVAEWREATRRRNADLAARIRDGLADEEPMRSRVMTHLGLVVNNKLKVDAPNLAR
ncbi:MAG: hypothetical protein HY875_06250 [Chloroflexi bacterium]|nr:hypothetical protein [Chloroflexota bacterium]